MNTSVEAILIKEWKSKSVSEDLKAHFDIQGYRGGRGLMPENTIPACIEAIKHEATTLHLDIVVSADKELVVAQDAMLSTSIHSLIDGSPLTLKHAGQFNIYKMEYEQLREFDCGSRRQLKFPEQKLMHINIPLLRQLIDRVEKFVLWNRQQPVKYNIELKSFAGGDDLFHPKPEVFALMVYDLLRLKAVLRRTIIQSSDVRLLKVFRKINSEITISYSTEEISWKIENDALQYLKPDFFAPGFRVVNRSLIESLHSQKIKILPKVVNEILDINEMKQLGADGVMTDYPDRAMKVLN